MAASWTCPGCSTINNSHSDKCMACDGAKTSASAKPTIAEAPTIKVTVAPAPSKASTAPAARPTARTPAAAPATPRPRPPATTTPPTTTTTRRPATGPTPRLPSTTAPPTPSVGPTTKRPATRGTRKFAVGKLLGLGHIALWMLTVNVYAFTSGWGRSLLTWLYHLMVQAGATFSGTIYSSLGSNQVVIDAADWSNHLPWGVKINAYYVLAVACLIIRFARRLPGWLSLAVTLPAAVYGILGAVSDLPSLLYYWPLTVVTLIAAWIVVGKTTKRY